MFESVDIYDRNIYESYKKKKDFFPMHCLCVVAWLLTFNSSTNVFKE